MLGLSALFLLALAVVNGDKFEFNERLDIISEDHWPILQAFDRSVLDEADLMEIGFMDNEGTYAVLHTTENRTYLTGKAGRFHLDVTLGETVTREISEIRGRRVRDMRITHSFIAILCEDGSFWTAGNNLFGQLGHHGIDYERHIFSQVEGLPPVKKFATGNWHVIAITQFGQLFSWGEGSFDRLGYTGNQGENPVPRPFTIEQGGTPEQICCTWISCALLTDKAVLYTWGNPELLGRAGSSLPEQVTGIPEGETIVKVVCGNEHLVALSSTGVLYGWGYLTGRGTTQREPMGYMATPTALDFDWRIVRDVVAGYLNTIMLTYSPVVEHFGFVEERTFSTPTYAVGFTHARDMLAESMRGQQTWGAVYLNSTVRDHY